MKTVEVEKLINIMQREVVNGDLKNLASTNVGSFHKEKDEIVNSVCRQAQDAIEFQNLCLNCLLYLSHGGTIEDYVNGALKEASRTNQPQVDRDAKMKVLQRFSIEVVEL